MILLRCKKTVRNFVHYFQIYAWHIIIYLEKWEIAWRFERMPKTEEKPFGGCQSDDKSVTDDAFARAVQ